MRYLNILIVATFLILTSCSNDEGIDDAKLSGMVLGESFTAVGGNAFVNGTNLSINISNEIADCDSDISLTDSFLFFEVPNGTGPYVDITLTFAGNGKNSVEYSDATIIIKSIKGNLISVQIVSVYNDDNNVEGNFIVPFCE